MATFRLFEGQEAEEEQAVKRPGDSQDDSYLQAWKHYWKGEHQQCKKHLEQVQSQKTGASDVRVAHNVAVNAYFASGCADPQDLLSKLTTHYDRALAALPTATAPKNKGNQPTKHLNQRQRKKAKAKAEEKEDNEEDAMREENYMYRLRYLDVLRYNQALLCVQLRNYAQALHILEELFENIEPIDDFLAIKICFLLLELYLLQREPEQGLNVLTFLEKPQAFHSLLKSDRPDQRKIDALRMEEEEEGEEGRVREDEEPKVEAAVAENVDVKPEKQEVTGPLPSLVFGAFLTKHGRAPDTISPAEFKFNCLVYRVRMHLATRNLTSAEKDCKKALELLESDLKSAPLLWPHSLSNEADDLDRDPVRQMLNSHERSKVQMLKAYLEYAKGNFRKALKLMSSCSFYFAEAGDAESKAHKGEDDEVDDHIPTDFHPAQDDACSPLFFNNMGCVHFMMHKPNLAAYYFSKALSKSIALPSHSGQAKAHSQGDRSMLLSARTGLPEPGHAASMHWLDKRAEITFNVGLQFLLTGRSAQASKCFEQCIPVLRSWPRLWIRIAECCIELYQQSQKSDTEAQGVGMAGQTPASFQSWNRQKAAHGLIPNGGDLCGSLGPTAVGSGVSKLACGAQGFGIHRRVLMMVDKTNMVGNLPKVDQMYAHLLATRKEGPRRAGPAGAAPPPQDEVSDSSDPKVTDPLVAAAMCLKNVLILVDPQLRADTDGASRQSPSSKLAPGDMAEMEANLLEDAALLKLAWVYLCQRDHVLALRYSKRLLEKNNLLPETHGDPNSRNARRKAALDELKKSWTFQAHNLPHSKHKKAAPVKWPSSLGSIASAVCYLSEALLMGGRVTEARQVIQSFGDKSLGHGLKMQAAFVQAQEKTELHSATVPILHERVDKKEEDEEGLFEGCPAQTCGGGLSAATPMGGLTPPSYSICCAAASQGHDRHAKGENEREKAKDEAFAVLVNYERASFPALGAMACMMQTNLACALAHDGAFEEAQRACDKALQLQPKALLPLKTSCFLLLRNGQSGEAMRRLKGEQPLEK